MARVMKILFCTVVLLLCSSFAGAQSAGSGGTGVEFPVVTVGTDLWPPFRVEGRSRGIDGIDIELLNVVGKRMGVTFSVFRFPWSRCLLNMENGQQDLMPGLAKTTEREQFILYTDKPYYTCYPAFYGLKKRGVIVDGYDDLYGKSIGYTRGSAYFSRFDNDTVLEKLDKNRESQLIQMLLADRLDLIIGTDCQVEYELAQMDRSSEIRKMAYKPKQPIDLYFGVSRQSAFVGRMDELNRVLEELVADGTVERISSRYLGDHYSGFH
ncbi:MAG: substrate-binding periplasmic protein [Desulfovibrio sp.]